MNPIQLYDRFDLDNDPFLYHLIRNETHSKRPSPVDYVQLSLLLNFQSGSIQLLKKCCFIYRLQQAPAEFVVNPEYRTADDVGQLIFNHRVKVKNSIKKLNSM